MVVQRDAEGVGTVLPGDERDELLALLSHELRTPLAPFGGFVETVLDRYADQVGPDAERLLHVALRNATRLQDAIDRVLRTTSALAGSGLVVEDVALREVCTAAAADVSGLDAGIEVPAELHVTVGREQLRLLLGELFENAHLHGAPPVHCVAELVDGLVELRITDAGPGIDPRFARRMFEGFTQPGSVLQRQQGGLGLGLRMAHGLALLVGAELAHEEADPGACFVVRLPLARPRALGEDAGPSGGMQAQDEPRPLAVRRAVAEAHHRMTLVENPTDVRVVLADLVRAVGAWFVDPDAADEDTIVIDLAMGKGPPLFAAATGRTRAVLEREVPALLELGTTVLDAGHRNFDAVQVVDLLAVNAVQPIRRDLERRYAQGQRVARIIEEVLAPALREIGTRWESGTWSVADQQAATELLDALVATLELRLRTGIQQGPRVTIVAVPGDHHPMPLRLLLLELLERDLDVRWIGGSTPAGAVDRDLAAHPPDALLLGCSFGPLLGGAIDIGRVAAARGVPVVLGGNAVARHPALATLTGCMVAADGAATVEDLLSRPLPPVVPAVLDTTWVAHAAAARGDLLPAVPPRLLELLSDDEIHWLGDAVALVRWQPELGAHVLEEYLDVVGHAHEERGRTATELSGLAAVAWEVAEA